VDRNGRRSGRPPPLQGFTVITPLRGGFRRRHFISCRLSLTTGRETTRPRTGVRRWRSVCRCGYGRAHSSDCRAIRRRRTTTTTDRRWRHRAAAEAEVARRGVCSRWRPAGDGRVTVRSWRTPPRRWSGRRRSRRRRPWPERRCIVSRRRWRRTAVGCARDENT